jgi:hypothetical protein
MILCVLSLVWTVIYAVFSTLGHLGGIYGSPYRMIVIASMLFILPFVILYTISTNNPASRILLISYFGFGLLVIEKYWPVFIENWLSPIPIVGGMFAIVTVCWLVVSPGARVYYALISGRTIPADLEDLADKYVSSTIPTHLIRRMLALMDSVVLVAFIVVSILLIYAGLDSLGPPQ